MATSCWCQSWYVHLTTQLKKKPQISIDFNLSTVFDLATTTAAPLQPPQIVNPVLGGQDVRNVAANQMDIRNADPRDIRLSNGYVSKKLRTMLRNGFIYINLCFCPRKKKSVHTLTFQWRINVIQPETYFVKFPEMSAVIFVVFQVSLKNWGINFKLK